MPETLGEAVIAVGADLSKFDTELKKGVKDSSEKIKPTTDTQGKQTGSTFISGLGKGLKKVAGVAGVVSAGAAIAGAFTKGWSRLTAIENAKATLKGLGNSSKDVALIMKNANDSVTGTYFGLDAAATTAAGAVAAGIKPGKQLGSVLKNVANSAATAKVPMADMGAIFNKVASLGKAQNDSLQQVANQGIPIYEALAKQLGVTTDEVFDMASKGKINFKQFSQAMKSASGTVADELGKTTTGTLKNMGAAISRFTAEILSVFMPIIKRAAQIVTTVFNEAKKVLEGVFNFISSHERIFKSLAAAIGVVATGFALYKIATLAAAAASKIFAFGIKGIGAAIKSNPLGLILTGLTLLVTALIYAWNNSKTFRDIVIGVFNAVKGAVLAVINWFTGVFIPFFTVTIPAAFSAAWNFVRSIAVTVWNAIAGFFSAALSAFVGFFTSIWNTVVSIFSGVWNAIRATAVAIWNGIYAFFAGAFAAFTGFFTAIWNGILALFRGIWNNLRSAAETAWNGIRSFFSGAFSAFTGFFSSTWNGIVNTFTSIFGKIKDVAQGVWDGVVGIFKKGVNAVTGAINSWFIKPINAITGLFGIKAIPPIPEWKETGGVMGYASMPSFLARGGTIGNGFITSGPTAIVGEGNPRYPEAVIPTDPKYASNAKRLVAWTMGQLGIPSDQMLARGGRVGGSLPARSNNVRLEGGGLFSFVGDVVSGALDVLKSVGNTLKGWVEGALDLLKKGVAWAMEHTIKPIIDKVKKFLPDNFIGRIAKGVMDTVYNGIHDWLVGKKKDLDEANKKAGESAAASKPGPGGGVEKWRNVALTALAAAGQSSKWIDRLLMQMNSESGGNPKAVNNWDINAKKGTPSKGLMQVIQPTFDAYAGTWRSRGIYDPFANIYAAIMYTVSRYGSLAAWKGHGYDSGGFLAPGLTLANNRTGRPEAVLTPRQSSALVAIAENGGGTTFGDVIVTLSVDDIKQMKDIEQFLNLLKQSRNRRRKTARSGVVVA